MNWMTTFGQLLGPYNHSLQQGCQTDPEKGHVAAGFHSNQARTRLIQLLQIKATVFIETVWVVLIKQPVSEHHKDKRNHPGLQETQDRSISPLQARRLRVKGPHLHLPGHRDLW